MDPETAIKIAVDLGIETPDFIPAVSVIRNILKVNHPTILKSFENALKDLEEHPDLAIGSANSTLESIIKHILENENISTPFNQKSTLYDLTQSILKEFAMFPDENIPDEIRNIGSGLLKLSQNVEKLRSEKTAFHGKTKQDYIIEEPLYAYFIVNLISTIGLFLISFYEKKYNNENIGSTNVDTQEAEIEAEIEADTDDVPF